MHHFAEAPKREGKLRGKKRTRQRQMAAEAVEAGRRSREAEKHNGRCDGDPQPGG